MKPDPKSFFEENAVISFHNYFFKKEGFYKPFVVLVLRCEKIEKKLSGKMKSDISQPDPLICFILLIFTILVI